MSFKGSEAWQAENRGPGIVSACWTMAGLATAFVSARIWCRHKVGRKVYSDDYYCILSLICAIASCVATTIAVSYGYGKHMEVLTHEQQKGAIMWAHIGFAPGIMSFAIPKMAVVALLTRLMNPARYHLWFLWGITVLCLLTHIIVPGLHFGRCVPVQAIWDNTISAKCFDANITVDYSIYGGILSAFVDVYLAIYPTVILFGLQMSLKKKIFLSCALSVGSMYGRLPYPLSSRGSSVVLLRISVDHTRLTRACRIEGSTIIIASTIPVLQPLLEVILRRSPFSTARSALEETPKSDDNFVPKRESDVGGRIELGQRRPKPKLRDNLGLTIMEDDSKENILVQENTTPVIMSDKDETTQPQPTTWGITRTDVVCVSFEDRSKLSEKPASAKWDIV
ncbi:uncharacterized protein CTRU02_213147 [Colletotrichum truncatum]|uniref:Integral membrane protein n=1 Tax=Colletotrichum truncatum TaxID=5467 RepID=A0ACC3YJW1_COLTU|nr:uncharacterized protein CTRU02_03466 [Colletotrichum truncatum]KAF6797435.1 integral membrane protein [Colletotrichum truncatum]